MQALVLEPDLKLNLREITIDEPLGPHDVRIDIRSVGVCCPPMLMLGVGEKRENLMALSRRLTKA